MTTNDPFLDEFQITDERGAMQDSFSSAVKTRRGLPVYQGKITESDKKKLRENWENVIRQEAQTYVSPPQRITDKQHCDAIARIAKTLSNQFGSVLHNRTMRFGISQKAFNLYLKYLWRLGKIPEPPHCPIDDVVLRMGGLCGSWTNSDDRQEYMDWTRWLRMRAKRMSLTLAVWEYSAWWVAYQKKTNRIKPDSS